ncbi:hypothetical protein GCM10010448_63280 [Streptomyces glomeratus]|uniref:Uncharacterized protein n=1 Tax=Streptomyces glomeratus TaxID=284452 RepID=A0ABP6M1Z3_9ACTN
MATSTIARYLALSKKASRCLARGFAGSAARGLGTPPTGDVTGGSDARDSGADDGPVALEEEEADWNIRGTLAFSKGSRKTFESHTAYPPGYPGSGDVCLAAARFSAHRFSYHIGVLCPSSSRLKRAYLPRVTPAECPAMEVVGRVFE